MQPAKGYRFSVDALLLAFFASRFDPVSFVDVGAGCGICSLALMRHSSRSQRVILFEIQPDLARCARRNMRLNVSDEKNWSIRSEDVRYAMLREPVDLVMANPPFRSPENGRVSPVPQRALARHGYRLSAFTMALSASRMLRPEGVACIIVPPAVEAQWIRSFREVRLSPLIRCPVFSTVGGAEVLTLLAFARSAESTEMDPVILRDTSGNYTPTARFIMGIV